MPSSTTSDRVRTLRSLTRLLVDTSEAITKEWETEEHHRPGLDGTPTFALPSRKLYEARRIVRGACDMFINLVEDPRHRIQELAESFAATKALDTTLRAGVPDILAEAGPLGSVSAAELSQRTGIDEGKLVRVMRLLCSSGIYDEVEHLQFVNTGVSRVFVANPPAKAFHNTEPVVDALEYLPATLLDRDLTSSTSATDAAFQNAHGTKETLWDYTERGDKTNPNVLEIREMFPLSMVGEGQMSSPSLLADFPWGSLGEATVVDIGGGVGSMCLELAKAFPDLRFVVEDLPVTIEKAKSVWSAECGDAVEAKRVQLLSHDFFTEQPVKGADVYFLRCILHDWPDDDCVKILSRLREAMSADSRILVADMVIHPPLGSMHLTSAPAPLPANFGGASAFQGMRDIFMLAMFNGAERTPEQLGAIANRAGLEIVKIWECRGPLSITELRAL
ncbi:S-adenosyl-L-methionine-dependent methyltransferase [Daedalea quercina L-15889]|uniref:S-adenosyl-L-methionine-dependent methyltransferase n=1 Tax=Daedalea quercina L-15889 TaxID=1314783 RepID=A0A165U0Q7_9APHY|nr:S-adenosyl-L-methionine-dependent methyltransferase [Daedalea quercina L-15889]